MHARFVCILLALLCLTACAGYRRADTLPVAQATRSQAQATIGFKSKSKYVTSLATQVFNANGWNISDDPNVPLLVEVSVGKDQYNYPGFLFLYLGTAGVLPLKVENYYWLSAKIYINGREQDRFTYVDDITVYANAYGPASLLMPGVTHREFGLSSHPPAELMDQARKNLMQHLVDDIRARYYTDNYQETAI